MADSFHIKEKIGLIMTSALLSVLQTLDVSSGCLDILVLGHTSDPQSLSFITDQ